MRQTLCPVCKTEPPLGQNSLDLVPCTICGVTWTYLPEEINLTSLYLDEVYEVVDNRRSLFEKIIFREGNNVLTTLDKIFKFSNAKDLLDFGSGKGQFLYLAHKHGWNTFGVETSKPRAKFSKEKYGIKVKEDEYVEGKITIRNFDVITLFHVLEHLPNPLDLIQKLCKDNLKTGGVLVIEVPNFESWQSKWAGKDWMHLDLPKHLSHWTPSDLESHFSTLGFASIYRQHFSLHLGVLGMLRTILGKFGYNGNIILQLKKQRSFGLILAVIFFLPWAFMLESISCLFRRGGIIRIYFKKHE